MTVSERFDALIASLNLTRDQAVDGETKHKGVRRCLNRNYYDSSSDTANSILVGSWGKSTRIRPPRDIDVLFVLPESVYHRFQQRPGNKQSQLLQEVKGILQATYTSTNMSGDRQVVVVPFSSYAVEVVPAFLLQSGQYWICDTNNGGRYVKTDPKAEIGTISASNVSTNRNTTRLIRMMKRWQEHCNVPLKSFMIELLAIEFLGWWAHAGESATYHDWMVRDFLAFLMTKAHSFVIVPGTYEIVWLGDAWKSRADTALGRARTACDHEAGGYPCLAGDEWQKIFGPFIPMC